MSMEVINIVQKAEADAEKIRLDALQKAKDIIRQAEEEGQRSIDEVYEQSDAERKTLIAAAERKAQEEISNMTHDTDQKCKDIVDAAQGRMVKAVDLIMRKVVGSDGNS